MKDLIEMLLKAQNILKIIVILYMIISCRTQKKVINNVKNYKIEKYKSKGFFTGVVVKTYDNVDRKLLLPSTVIINKVYMEGILFSLGLGEHNIEILYPSKKIINIKKLKIELRDSIIIKAFLEDDLIIN